MQSIHSQGLFGLGWITRNGLVIQGVVVIEITLGQKPLVGDKVLITVEVVIVTDKAGITRPKGGSI